MSEFERMIMMPTDMRKSSLNHDHEDRDNVHVRYYSSASYSTRVYVPVKNPWIHPDRYLDPPVAAWQYVYMRAHACMHMRIYNHR